MKLKVTVNSIPYEIEVEVEPTPNSTDDAAEQAQPPVDSAQE